MGKPENSLSKDVVLKTGDPWETKPENSSQEDTMVLENIFSGDVLIVTLLPLEIFSRPCNKISEENVDDRTGLKCNDNDSREVIDKSCVSIDDSISSRTVDMMIMEVNVNKTDAELLVLM